MKIIKRDQSFQIYDRQKISRAVSAAFESVGHSLSEVQKEVLLDQVEVQIRTAGEIAPVSVEQIQDWVEQALMQQGCYEEARHYILYDDIELMPEEEVFGPTCADRSISCAGLYQMMKFWPAAVSCSGILLSRECRWRF